MYGYTNRKCTVGLKSKDQKRESKKLSLTVGVFFDGTGNNKYNVNFWEEREHIPTSDKENYTKYHNMVTPQWWHRVTPNVLHPTYDSYKKSTKTNIAILWYLYNTLKMPDAIKVYVEGPGTNRPSEKIKQGTRYNDEEGKVSSGNADNDSNSAFGNGGTGVNAKIETACKLSAQKIANEIRKRNLIPNELFLTFDVFGFSRGAAEARSFINRMFLGRVKNDKTEGRNVCLEKHLIKHGIKSICPKIHMNVRFLGIFDTVSSYSSNFSINPDFSNDVQELARRIPSYVRQSVHLVAADEYRIYFALTNANSARGRCKEIILPGAHSDIGGGYLPIEKEEIMMNGESYGPRQCRGYKSLKELYDEKWISEIWYRERDTYLKRLDKGTIREVKGDYSKIPLYIMGENIKNGGISLKEDVFKTFSSLSGKNISPKLKALRQLLLSKRLYHFENGKIKFSGTPNDMKLIYAVRAEYIHLSAHKGISSSATKNNVRIVYNG